MGSPQRNRGTENEKLSDLSGIQQSVGGNDNEDLAKDRYQTSLSISDAVLAARAEEDEEL